MRKIIILFLLCASCAAQSFPPLASAAATSEIEPSRQVYPNSTLQTLTYFDPQPANLIDVNEQFVSNTGQFTAYNDSGTTPGSFSVTGGQGVFTYSSNSALYEVENSTTQIMPEVFVSGTIASVGASTGSYRDGRVGLFADGANYLIAIYDFNAGHLRLGINVAGTFTLYDDAAQALTPPFQLGLSLVGNSATVWYNQSGTWVPFASHVTSSEYDFTLASNLSGTNWRGGCGGFNQSGSWGINYSNLKIGRFGGVVMRDQTPISSANGSIYSAGNTVYFMATIGDPAGQASVGIFSMDVTTNVMTEIGAMMFSRSSHIYPDVAGWIVRNSSTDYQIWVSSWATNPTVVVLYSGDLTGIDLMTGTHVVSVSTVTLPNDGGTPRYYDPALVFDGSKWMMAYTLATAGTTFFPALATSTDLSTWTLVKADSSVSGAYEGTRISLINHKYWIFCGGPLGNVGSSTTRIYDSGLNFITDLNATFSQGGPNPPHATIFPVGPDFYLFSFNGTQYGGLSGNVGQPTIQKAARYW